MEKESNQKRKKNQHRKKNITISIVTRAQKRAGLCDQSRKDFVPPINQTKLDLYLLTCTGKHEGTVLSVALGSCEKKKLHVNKGYDFPRICSD